MTEHSFNFERENGELSLAVTVQKVSHRKNFRSLPSFVTAHALCASRDGPSRKLGFPMDGAY